MGINVNVVVIETSRYDDVMIACRWLDIIVESIRHAVGEFPIVMTLHQSICLRSQQNAAVASRRTVLAYHVETR